MSEMVERVARAIHDHWQARHRSWAETCVKLPAQAEDFRAKARAAIEAMREPTDKMLRDGVGYSDWIMPRGLDCSPEGYTEEMKCGWHVMIDAALQSP